MSWIQKLYETYDQCSDRVDANGVTPWPLSHLEKKAHVEVVIDSHGNFRRVKQLDRFEASTIIPVTEFSAGRTRKIAPHPLCEEIDYCANDFPELHEKKHEAYIKQLRQWCASTHTHPKAEAILAFLLKSSLWSELNAEQLFPLYIENAAGKKTKIPDKKVFVRWRVETDADPQTSTWGDAGLIQAWADFDLEHNSKTGYCMVLGQVTRICESHPRFIRWPGDGAKLISSNDSAGYTFKGRFTDQTGQQAGSISFEVTQKAHNALRWLIQRQAYRHDGQVIVTWALTGKPVPDPFNDSRSLFLNSEELTESPAAPEQSNIGDVGQAFARRLRKAVAGYRAQLNPTDEIVVMGLDSATPGRMAVIFYRELMGAEFLDRIQSWHQTFAWQQNFGKDSKFVGAPAPSDIAEAAYGHRLDDKLRKATVERLLPCIVDGRPLARDLVESLVSRASNRVGMDRWEWEKTLGIACALFKGFYTEENHQMTLETERATRDYLYGRLLSIAEHIESRALYVGGENRDTTATKLMQRFADRPASTWRTIELALTPSKSRLRAKRAGFLYEMEKLHDEVVSSFIGDDFLDDRKLSGEFLLGYHCQRREFHPTKQDTTAADELTTAE
ncbi:MAG: type I-C CRISPR-associated protein Cas8c/Csd1 [Pseudomonadales bacterium]|nr:type I-C CRISPR-associated protein Cas8c/Csd1 [Pseudomonadales bacterium]